jgi:signal transduction histidine kinase
VLVQARVVCANYELRVTDSGRGMTEAQLARLGAFRQFERAKFEQQGLGLGLFIVRQILRRTRGTLTIESTPGQGTCCMVRLPVHHPAESAGPN